MEMVVLMYHDIKEIKEIMVKLSKDRFNKTNKDMKKLKELNIYMQAFKDLEKKLELEKD